MKGEEGFPSRAWMRRGASLVEVAGERRAESVTARASEASKEGRAGAAGESRPKEAKGRRVKAAGLRTLSALFVVGLVCLGLAAHTGTGSPSAFGFADVAALCPLGGLEAMIASKTVVPPLLIGLAIVVVLTLLLGRAFCAWGCPVPLLRRVFGGKRSKERAAGKESGPAAGADAPIDSAAKRTARKGLLDVAAPERGGVHDARNWVLGGTVLTTALFGFPVFCLVCPVGLTFGTLVVVWRLFQFNEVTWSLLVFPAILLIELVALRSWCHRFCPLGALLSLLSRANCTFRPTSQADVCLHTTRGQACHACADACPEGIDLHRPALSAPLNECLKCRECADACPVHAITFPLMPGTSKGRKPARASVERGDEPCNG